MTSEICSSSSTPEWKYDVFLSFRGEDTRKNFTDHLYNALDRKGIFTFRDDEKLERGKAIETELLKAIETSRIVIIVLSRDYASSTWCLKELSKIVEGNKVMGRKAFVVFFHVEPSDVRSQTGDFGKAFDKHEQEASRDKMVKKWREALTEIVDVPNTWRLNQRNESEVIEEIVSSVATLLASMSFSSSDEDLVGIDRRLGKLLQYLDTENYNDVRTIGIWGEEGMGKTALAEQAFMKIKGQFEASCFIYNVKNECESGGGLVHLQKRLYTSLLESEANIQTVQRGANILRNRLSHKKVLVVLDDVSQLEQMEKLVGKNGEQQNWFGKGSRVLVTTRNKQLLRRFRENCAYELEKLSDSEALQLFCKKAFEMGHLEDEYREIWDELVTYANGHPLTLINLGSLLFKRDVDSWSSELARLKNQHDDETDKFS